MEPASGHRGQNAIRAESPNLTPTPGMSGRIEERSDSVCPMRTQFAVTRDRNPARIPAHGPMPGRRECRRPAMVSQNRPTTPGPTTASRPDQIRQRYRTPQRPMSPRPWNPHIGVDENIDAMDLSGRPMLSMGTKTAADSTTLATTCGCGCCGPEARSLDQRDQTQPHRLGGRRVVPVQR